MKKIKKQRKVNKKRKILKYINNHKIYTVALALVCFMIVILGTKATYSALTAKDDVPNDMEISDFRLAINEEFVPEQGFTKGKKYQKEVSFENKTNMQMFVGAVKINSTINVYFREQGETDPEYFLTYSINNNDTHIVDYEINTTDWIEVDGLYYYKYKLKQGEKTTPLLYSVTPQIDLNGIFNEFENSPLISSGLPYEFYPGVTTQEDATKMMVLAEARGASATPDGYRQVFFSTTPTPPIISAIYDPQVISD